MNTFFNNYLDAIDINNIVGWYGSNGMSFYDPDTAYTLEKALKAVKDIDNISVDYTKETKLYHVWYEPKTAIASAIGKAILDSFKNE